MHSDPTSGVRVKVERAREQIGDLEREIAAFRQSDAYSVVGEEDPNTGEWVLRAQVREYPPPKWGAVAGDALHNLRSALDMMWFSIRHPHGGVWNDRETQFPICESADSFVRVVGRIEEGFPKPAMDILKAVKPYKGGNNTLWLLSRLNNIDKHQTLIPAYSSVGGVWGDANYLFFDLIGMQAPEGTIVAAPFTKPICPVEDGTELWRVGAQQRAQMNMDLQFPLQIAFGKAPIVEGKPFVPTLRRIEAAAGGTLRQFTPVLP